MVIFHNTRVKIENVCPIFLAAIHYHPGYRKPKTYTYHIRASDRFHMWEPDTFAQTETIWHSSQNSTQFCKTKRFYKWVLLQTFSLFTETLFSIFSPSGSCAISKSKFVKYLNQQNFCQLNGCLVNSKVIHVFSFLFF